MGLPFLKGPASASALGKERVEKEHLSSVTSPKSDNTSSPFILHGGKPVTRPHLDTGGRPGVEEKNS